MNDIQIFNNEEFGAVRTTGTPEQPLFCLADVARVLGLKTSKLVQRLSDDVLSKYPISDSLGREQVTNFINEDGLYDVILDSRKPEAKRFRKWVTSEVLQAWCLYDTADHREGIGRARLPDTVSSQSEGRTTKASACRTGV